MMLVDAAAQQPHSCMLRINGMCSLTPAAAVFCVWQVRSRDEELINLTSLHTATKAAADKRITDLEARMTKLLEANR
jgi:hypothetical protein